MEPALTTERRLVFNDHWVFRGIDVSVVTEFDDTDSCFISQIFRCHRLVGARRSNPVECSENLERIGAAAHQREARFIALIFSLAEKIRNLSTASVHDSLGQAFVLNGFLPEAEQEFLQALAIDARFALAHFHLGGVYHRLGKMTESEHEYKKALDQQPFADYANALGLLYLEQNRTDEAEKAFRRALAINPMYCDACLNLGHLYLEKAAKAETPLANELYKRAQDFLFKAYQLVNPAGDGAEPELPVMSLYDALCRLYLLTKNLLVARQDSSNLRTLCEIYLLALQQTGTDIPENELFGFIQHLHEVMINKPVYPDIKNYLGLIDFYVGWLMLSRAVTELPSSETDSGSWKTVQAIYQRIVKLVTTQKQELGV